MAFEISPVPELISLDALYKALNTFREKGNPSFPLSSEYTDQLYNRWNSLGGSKSGLSWETVYAAAKRGEDPLSSLSVDNLTTRIRFRMSP